MGSSGGTESRISHYPRLSRYIHSTCEDGTSEFLFRMCVSFGFHLCRGTLIFKRGSTSKLFTVLEPITIGLITFKVFI